MSHPPRTNQSASLQDAVGAAGSASDAPTGTPFACDRDLRDALNDLVQENRLSILKIEDPKCPMAACLEKRGLARWAPKAGPGKWVITQKGWLFLETRNRNAQETR